MIKIFLLFLVIILIVIQFFHPKKNISADDAASATGISLKYAVPSDVEQILKTACNDCHSNNTIYPWYSKIQPVDWWLNQHITEGKRELNFNEFLSYKAGKQFHKMEEMENEIKENAMPLRSYTIVHWNARLTGRQKQILIEWSKDIRAKMRAAYPADSLLKSNAHHH